MVDIYNIIYNYVINIMLLAIQYNCIIHFIKPYLSKSSEICRVYIELQQHGSNAKFNK